jgi:phosphoadenosine phosphosulfate reductase
MDKEQQAIERLKIASEMSLSVYEQPLIVTTSGGKDISRATSLTMYRGLTASQ